MSLCDLVEVHFQNIDAANNENNSYGIYTVEDLQADGDTVYGSWLIEGDSTYYAGGLIFALHFACLSDTGEVEYNLPTLSYSAITIGQTVWNSETIAIQYPNIIAEFEYRIAELERFDENLKPVTSVNGVEADENGNVQIETGGNTPVFDLAELGLATIPLTGGSYFVEADTSAIRAALENGAVTFVINVETLGVTIPANVTVTSASLYDAHSCYGFANLPEPAVIRMQITATRISVELSHLAEAVGIPAVTAADNGKVLQVVNGSLAAVSLEGSSIATYIDDYIGSALEGDY